jgi:FkbM family methyltransferase
MKTCTSSAGSGMKAKPESGIPMNTKEFFDALISSLPSIHKQHAPSTKIHVFLKKIAREHIEKAFGSNDKVTIQFGPYGDLHLPYLKLGAVDTMSLFDLDELIMFSYYWINRNRYHKVLDIGANLGLHSLILDRCGLSVRCYEPDPFHYEHLTNNLNENKCHHVVPERSAVSNQNGQTEFIRVLGNTMSSHIAGSKANPYGELEKFKVPMVDIKDLISWPDLIKMDAEGHEKEILLATEPQNWKSMDAMVEIGTPENAGLIFNHFKGSSVNLFTQKTNWEKAIHLEDLPTSYKEGTLFISCKNSMPWSESEF